MTTVPALPPTSPASSDTDETQPSFRVRVGGFLVLAAGLSIPVAILATMLVGAFLGRASYDPAEDPIAMRINQGIEIIETCISDRDGSAVEVYRANPKRFEACLRRENARAGLYEIDVAANDEDDRDAPITQGDLMKSIRAR